MSDAGRAMNRNAYESLKEAGRQSAFSRMVHSIRTRYSLATAFFLLLCLGIFYVGGRIVPLAYVA